MSRPASGARSQHSQRPDTAGSRRAWDENDDGGYDNPVQGMDDEDDMGPRPMQNEEQPPAVMVEQIPQEQEQQSGCWFKFKKGVRCKL